MFEYRTLPIRVIKGNNALHQVEVLISDQRAVFEFTKATPDANRASAPIVDFRSEKHTHTIETATKNYPNSDRRQPSFEAMICLLAFLSDDGNVPVVFRDASGLKKRLDKTCSEWALAGGKFLRVVDDNGHHMLRPK